MRLDRNNVYLFNTDNRYGIIEHTHLELFKGEFSIAITVRPDYRGILKEFEETNKGDLNSSYYNGCIVGATGAHQGAFISLCYKDSIPHFTFAYRWFEEGEIEKSIDLPLNPDLDLTLDIVVHKLDSRFYINVNGTKALSPYGNIIDYEYSYKWVGCANNLGAGKEGYDERYASIFQGDLTKLHIQNKLMSKLETDLVFKDYKLFKDSYLYLETTNSVLFSSDFSEFTPYKVKDFSANRNNIIKYDPRWFTN